MPFPLYMDVHVPAAITAGLRLRGVDVLTSQEDKTRSWTDVALLNRASEVHHILFTADEDLLAIARHWQETGREFFGVVYIHQLAWEIGRVVEDLMLISTCCEEQEIRNQVIYLPLR